VDIALYRRLVSAAGLLLLDEPSLGLAPILINKIFDMIDMIQENSPRGKVAILIVEQNARKALKVASRGYILELGKVDLQGNTSELSSNPKVSVAYLGGGTEGNR